MKKKKTIAFIVLLLQFTLLIMHVFRSDPTLYQDLTSRSLIEILATLVFSVVIILISGYFLALICFAVLSVTYFLGKIVVPIFGNSFENEKFEFKNAFGYILLMSLSIGYLWPSILIVLSIVSKLVPFMPDPLSLLKR